jgi:uncharacterized protein (TIGR00251 family)
MLITVKITPNSNEDKVIVVDDKHLKVRVRAAPEDGKANSALIEVLAKHYGVQKRCVVIKSGFTSKTKIILVEDT